MLRLILFATFLTPFYSCKKLEPAYKTEGVAITETYFNESCATYDTIYHLAYGIYIPNCFTPNGDGRNDMFYAKFSRETVSRDNYELKIFNSSNQLIFETHDIGEGWDGGKFPMRNYTFTLKVFEICRGIFHYYSGSVLLIRDQYN